MFLNKSFVLFGSIGLIILGVILRVKKRLQEKSKMADSEEIEVLEVKLSRNEEIPGDVNASALSAENMYAALHGLLKDDPRSQERVSFEMSSSGDRGISFYVVAPTNILKFVESQVYAQYPKADIKVVTDYTRHMNPRHSKFDIASVTFKNADFMPTKSFRDLELDTVSSVTSSVASLPKGEEVWLQVLVRPIADTWQQAGYDYVNAVREGDDPNRKKFPLKDMLDIFAKEFILILSDMITGFFTHREREEEDKPSFIPRLNPAEDTQMKSVENKLSRMGFETVIRVVSSASSQERVDSNLRSILASFEQFSTTHLNTFVSQIEKDKEGALSDYVDRRFDDNKSIILNTEELATFYHFPMSHIDTPNISWVYSRKSEPPPNLPTKDCVYIGETLFRNKTTLFGLENDDDRIRHLYVIGKSGTGKSSLFISMASQDIAKGEGVAILDPHGETIEQVLERIPENRIEDVIYIDPSDTESPVGLNLLELDDPSQKNLYASGLVDAIKQHFDFSWGPRLEYLLNYSILTLLEVPGTTMLGITRLLEDSNYLNYILSKVRDPVVLKFWNQEWKQMKGNQRFVTEAISPIQNKVNRFLASTTIRNILGQKKSTVDLWDAMNSGKIILINLAKGKIGSDNANLLGALLVSRIQFCALQRANIPYEDRKPFYLYVDEFQNFATGSFEEILSESRKYKLGLYLTHQFTAQLPEDLLKAVYGNVGTIMTFSLGAPDARELAKEFAPYFNEEDIISLGRFQVYIKLMIDGMTSHPFSARIILPWGDNPLVPVTRNRERAVQRSREKYGTDKAYVEEKVKKWLNIRFDKGMAIAEQYRENGTKIENKEGVKNAKN
ncbi:type IV secretory system conjugative DNA transfer family protein [Patescibacteria group bacterium]